MKRVRVALAAAAWLVALGFGAAAAAAAPPAAVPPGSDTAPWADAAPRPVAAPDYGHTLFEFYQGHPFAALTGLMVAQHFKRLGSHADEADLLRGGLLLAHGLHGEAGRVFAQWPATRAAPGARDRAWYFLALARQRRGLLAQAEEALARIAAPLPGVLQTERLLLQAQLLSARADHAGAVAVLQTVQGEDAAAPFARFNLAAALTQIGGSANEARARALLEALGTGPAADEEQRSLRDRANLALGLAALRHKQPREARVALQRVRLQGIESNQALLAYGWAAAGLNDPKLALVPWTELAARPEGDAAVLEARLAVPYALGALGAFGSALQGYEQAEAGCAREARALDDAIAAVRAGTLVPALLNDGQGPDSGIESAIEDRLDSGRTSDTHLRAGPGLAALPQPWQWAPLLSSHAFHEGLQNLRDLRFVERNVQQWQASLLAFDDVLAVRRRAYAERLPAALAQGGSAAIAALQTRRESLAAEIAQAEREQDAAAYARPAERQWLDRVERGRATLARLAAPAPGSGAAVAVAADVASATESLRRAAGALTWQMTQALPARSEQAREALRSADGALSAARAHDAALTHALRTEPARLAAFAERIAALRARLDSVLPQVRPLVAEQQAQLQDIAVAALQEQQQRLQVYAAQSRLAIAQILDNAQFARRPDDATAEVKR